MDSRLNMSLEEIISSKEEERNARKGSHSSGGGGIRSSQSRGGRAERSDMSVAPYQQRDSQRQQQQSHRASSSSRPTNGRSHTGECAIKFLMPNAFMGTVIGNGGRVIRELAEVTGANVHASFGHNFFPGSNDLRVLFIHGTIAQVSLAQCLLWEMLGQEAFAEKMGISQLPWSPAVSKSNPGEYDEHHVEGRIAVPAEAGGMLVGKQGATLKQIMQESGANVFMNKKEEGDVISERILNISGSVASCMDCTSIVLRKLSELRGGCEFTHSGSNYPQWIHQAAAAAGIAQPRSSSSTNAGQAGAGAEAGAGAGGARRLPLNFRVTAHGDDEDDYDERNRHRAKISEVSKSGLMRGTTGSSTGSGSGLRDLDYVGGDGNDDDDIQVLSATSTVELGVSDSLVGAILGKQGAMLQEIILLSGADIRVSKRGEYVEGTSQRLVTITGSPAVVQAAHTLICQRVSQERAQG